MVRPVSTAAREIGSERNRSMRPRCRSSARPTPVVSAPNTIVCTNTPGHQVVHVGLPRRQRSLDRAAEHVAEHQHEDDRLDRREHQQLGIAADVEDVAPRHDAGVGDERHRAPPSGCRLGLRLPAPPLRDHHVVVVGVGHLFGGVPGEREEHVVERGLAQHHRGRLDARRRRARALRRASPARSRRPTRRCARSRPSCAGRPPGASARGRLLGQSPRRGSRPRSPSWRSDSSTPPTCPPRSRCRGRSRGCGRRARSASSRYWVVSSTVVPTPDQAADHAPQLVARPSGRGRWSARRGTGPAVRAPARPRGRAGAACPPRRCAPAGRRPSPG